MKHALLISKGNTFFILGALILLALFSVLVNPATYLPGPDSPLEVDQFGAVLAWLATLFLTPITVAFSVALYRMIWAKYEQENFDYIEIEEKVEE